MKIDNTEKKPVGRPTMPETKIVTFRFRVTWVPHMREVIKKEVERLRKTENIKP